MERRRRLAATLGLVALVIVDIVLVIAALRITGQSSATETPVTDVTAGPTGSDRAPSPAETTPTPSNSAPSTTTSDADPANVPGGADHGCDQCAER
jgi:hypothetical protein